MKIIRIPGSKSIIIRLMIIATYLKKEISFSNWSNCSDVLTMENALKTIGFQINKDNSEVKISPLVSFHEGKTIQIKDSATAVRFLFSRLATIEKDFDLILSTQLNKRPHFNLIKHLNKNGGDLKRYNNHYKIIGKKYLNGGTINIDSSISSQFISSLLLIAPSYKNDLELHLKNKTISQSYIKMTISIMEKFGIKIKSEDNIIYVKKNQIYSDLMKFFVEPDFSSIAFFFVLAVLKINEGVFIQKLAQPSIQGDFNIIEILKNMNAEYIEKDKLFGFKKSTLKGISLDMSDNPDLVPILTIAALFARGKTEFKNISHLKYKESDRIKSLILELNKIGAEIYFRKNSLIVIPKEMYKPCLLETYDDHRICMSFSILKEVVPGIELSEIKSVKKSFPEFFDILHYITDINK